MSGFEFPPKNNITTNVFYDSQANGSIWFVVKIQFIINSHKSIRPTINTFLGRDY